MFFNDCYNRSHHVIFFHDFSSKHTINYLIKYIGLKFKFALFSLCASSIHITLRGLKGKKVPDFLFIHSDELWQQITPHIKLFVLRFLRSEIIH